MPAADTRFDLAVIGTGVAAMSALKPCAEAGWHCAIVDRLPYGGTCVLRGCDPKKLLRRPAELVDGARRMAGKGLADPELRVDWPAAMAFKRDFTDPVPQSREKSLAEQGVARFHGSARFLDGNTIAVGADRLKARHIVVATGAKPRSMDIPGAELLTTSDAFMNLDRLPRRILFVGGGYIGFELAHIAARSGAEVAILARGEQVLTGFDPDLAALLVERSRAAGIAVHTGVPVAAVEDRGDALQAVTDGPDGRSFAAEMVVHGAGRVPEIDDLDLEAAGIPRGNKGVTVTEFLRSTGNPAVYAAGDAADTGAPPLTPVASREGAAVAANLLHGDHERPDTAAVPSAVFTIPALARVGLTEAEAREQGRQVECRFTDMSGWYSSRRVGESHAAAKVLLEKGSGRILGAHLLGPEAAELINIFALAVHAGLDAKALKGFVTAYPSAGSDIDSLL